MRREREREPELQQLKVGPEDQNRQKRDAERITPKR